MMISTYLNRIDVGILESYPLNLFGSFCSNAHLSERQGSCKDLQSMFVFLAGRSSVVFSHLSEVKADLSPCCPSWPGHSIGRIGDDVFHAGCMVPEKLQC